MQRRRGTIGGGQMTQRWYILALFSLVSFWAVCFIALISKWQSEVVVTDHDLGRKTQESLPQKNGPSSQVSVRNNLEGIPMKPRNLSRTGKVIATADVRGNLGPASVVVQPRPGKDWMHDRWQAASDMHGTAIAGAHWIHLDFGAEIVPERIILDWEAAYSEKYRIEASLEPITDYSSKEKTWSVFDSTDPPQKAIITVVKVGQSPGVKSTTPLHVMHTLHPLQNTKPLRYMRLYILSSAMGWGVSLWQFDVIGYSKEDVIQ